MQPAEFDVEAQWQRLSAEVIAGGREWRLHHPQAPLQEIEAAVDERLAQVRARMRQDVALASRAAGLRHTAKGERPRCPHCGDAVEPRGSHKRHVTTQQNQTLTLRCSYAVCPTCQVGFFPLDEKLAWLPGQLTPRL